MSKPLHSARQVLALALCLCLPAVSLAQQASGSTAATLQVDGFRVEGASPHPERGLTPDTVQALATRELDRQRPAPGQPASLSFAQIAAVADAITAAYRQAGFPVATAVVPVQQVGADQVVRLQVVEGKVGKVIVHGDSRYGHEVLADPLRGLAGTAPATGDLQSAMLYARDIPGVSVSSTLVPGENPGETDIVLEAHDTRRPLQASLAVNNHGTEQTGRGRAELGLDWLSPLGLGDIFSASYAYAFDPEQSRTWAASWSVPVAPVRGLSLIAGASRSELELRNGPLAALGLSGPSTQRYLGGDWKFVNTVPLQLTGSARYVRESSRIDALGIALSDQQFDVAELGLSLRADETGSHAANLLRLSVRQAVDDASAYPDYVSPHHDRRFLLGRLDYLRLQPLSAHQRLLLRLSGQYTRDALVPMEQFGVGGADSVRAYPLNEALGDRGYLASVQLQADAPGFAGRPSPFGANWGEVLSLNLFVDQGRTLAAGANRGAIPDRDLAGIGAGASFHLPRFHALQFDLAASVPTSAAEASDGRDARVYAQLALTF